MQEMFWNHKHLSDTSENAGVASSAWRRIVGSLFLSAALVATGAACDGDTGGTDGDAGEDQSDDDDDMGDEQSDQEEGSGDEDSSAEGSVSGSHMDIPEEFEGKSNDKEGDEAAIEAGEELYSKNCTACHGTDAKGVTGLGSALVGKDPALADDFFLWRVMKGVETMTPFEGKLSEDEVWEILSYVRSIDG